LKEKSKGIVTMRSKVWEFSSLKPVYTQYKNTKFNGFIMSVLSIALKKQMEKLGSRVDKIITAVPINMRPPARSLDDVKVENLFSYSKFEFPLLNDMSELPLMVKALEKSINYKDILTSVRFV
jgi:hypothetical protein